MSVRYAGANDQSPWRPVSNPRDKRELEDVVRQMEDVGEKGCEPAQRMLAAMYNHGQGVRKNQKTALEWYRKSAEQGNKEALFSIGTLYGLGEGGVPLDDVTALTWYRKAAEKGHGSSIFNVANAYRFGNSGVRQNDATAAEWYRKGDRVGHAGSQYNLGSMYLHGEGVPQNHDEAFALTSKAANQGYPSAIFNVACMHANGRGTPQDDSEALRWFYKAQAHGATGAAGAIKKILQGQRERRAAAAAAVSPITIGAVVELCDLKANPELNGKWGIVTGFDPASGRCKVEVKIDDIQETMKAFKLLPGNLVEKKFEGRRWQWWRRQRRQRWRRLRRRLVCKCKSHGAQEKGRGKIVSV